MNDSTVCPLYNSTPVDQKPAFKSGHECGYFQGMTDALDLNYMKKLAKSNAKRLIPVYAGAGFIIGVLMMLFVLNH